MDEDLQADNYFPVFRRPEPVSVVNVFVNQHFDILPISETGLINDSTKVGATKVPSPNCVLNISLKAAAESRPEIFLQTCYICLMGKVFLLRWKLQKFVLLPKSNKLSADPS